MELAATIGISITEFWELTPAEFFILVKGYEKRKEIEAQEYMEKVKIQQILMVKQAFLISRWVWQKKVDIDRVLKSIIKEEKTKEMTDEQMLAQVKALNALFGGEVRLVGKE